MHLDVGHVKLSAKASQTAPVDAAAVRTYRRWHEAWLRIAFPDSRTYAERDLSMEVIRTRHSYAFILQYIAASVIWSLSLGIVVAQPPEVQREYLNHVRPFLAKHCLECHGANDGKAGLTLHDLGSDLTVGDNADRWKEVIDRINLGEMPPRERPRPDAQASFAVVRWVGSELKRAERQARMAGGRVLMRRLNRREYINTVRDLLLLDDNFAQALKHVLPADGKVEGFDRVGAALFVDANQMASYLAAARMIADKAIVSGPAPEMMTVVSEAESQTRRTRDIVREDVLGIDLIHSRTILPHPTQVRS